MLKPLVRFVGEYDSHTVSKTGPINCLKSQREKGTFTIKKSGIYLLP